MGGWPGDLPHYPILIRIAPSVRFDDPAEGRRLFDDELVGRNELAVLSRIPSF
jgi:hypothetical protein